MRLREAIAGLSGKQAAVLGNIKSQLSTKKQIPENLKEI
jgi:hypothetical protein